MAQDAHSDKDARVLDAIATLVPSASDPNVMDALRLDYPIRHPANAKALEWSTRTRVLARLRAVALLVLIYYVALPISLAAAAAVWTFNYLFPNRSKASTLNGVTSQRRLDPRGTALVSGGNKTKALHVARHLHRAGYRVVLVDSDKNWASCTRFSNSVDGFHAVPIANKHPLEYLKAMSRIGARENVSLFVPVSIAQYSVYEALAADLMPIGCHSCTLSAADVALLNDKIKFQRFCTQHNLTTPNVMPVTSKEGLKDLNARPDIFEGKRYLLKSVHYSALSRADLFTLPCSLEVLENYIEKLDISEQQPWLLQQFLKGPEYASYSIVDGSNVIAHADNVAELSCLNYAHVGNPEILKWVQRFCEAHPCSGQVCFDYMLNKEDGQLYCIECNPRTSTNVLAFQNDPRLALAFFNPVAVRDSATAPLQPLPSHRPTYWVWNEVGNFVFSDVPANVRELNVRGLTQSLWDLGSRLLAGSDAVADSSDPLPFFVLHFLQIPLQLVRILVSGNLFKKVDLCSGKVVELGGD